MLLFIVYTFIEPSTFTCYLHVQRSCSHSNSMCSSTQFQLATYSVRCRVSLARTDCKLRQKNTKQKQKQKQTDKIVLYNIYNCII